MNERALRPGGRYLLKHTSRLATAIVEQIEDLVDVHTLERGAPAEQLALNDIGRVRLRTSVPLRSWRLKPALRKPAGPRRSGVI